MPDALACLLLDWGDTVMRVFPDCPGPMATWPRVEVLPGVRECLERLEGRIRVALATNAQDSEEPEIRAALARVGIAGHFERVYCFRGVGVLKASPRFFAVVLAELGLPPERVVMVGDDLAGDAVAAVAAGLRGVWLRPAGQDLAVPPGVAVVDSLEELPGLLGRWGLLA